MKKILFIDDNAALREETLDALQLEGFDVFSADCGLRGIEVAKEQIPDLILCDIMMPEIDGYEVYRQLKATPTTSLIPFIFLTALAEHTDLRKGMNLGADDYVFKPIQLTELLQTINTRLGKSIEIKNQIKRRMDELNNRIIHLLPHELLTPLNGILGFSSLIYEESGNLNRHEISEMALAIQTSGNRLLDLINNYLRYVSVTSKDFNTQNIKINHVSGIIKEISLRIAEKYHRIEDLVLELDEADVMIEYDDFEFLIKELVDNAFKFSESNSNIIVLSTLKDQSLEIRITDHGTGFPFESMEDIGAFNQFNRKKLEQQGSGLGLITSMLIAQRYHGSVQFKNDKFGATVILTLPNEQ